MTRIRKYKAIYFNGKEYEKFERKTQYAISALSLFYMLNDFNRIACLTGEPKWVYYADPEELV